MRVSTVVTSSAERAASARRAHPGVKVVSSVPELVADLKGIDLVVIASPNWTHVPLARQFLLLGLPLVVDKPFTLTADEAEELVDMADKKGAVLTVFQNRRWDGDFLTAGSLIDSGCLGEVRRFESRFERWRPVPRNRWREVGGVRDGAGVLYDLGSHLVDQALSLFGPVASAYCELNRRRLGVRSDDDAFVALTHTSGVRSHLWMSSVAPQFGPRFRVLGSDAAYVTYGLDPQETALRAGRSPGVCAEPWGTVNPDYWGKLIAGDAVDIIETMPGNYPAFYSAVADCLMHGAPVPVDPRESVSVVRLLEKAREAAF